MESISTATRNYLAAYEPFQLFGIVHTLTIIATIGAAIGLPWCAKRFLSERDQVVVGVVLGSLVAASYFVWIGLEAAAGTFGLDQHLPLHLCWVANLALPVALSKRAPLVFEIVYYWGIAAGLEATITPTLEADFPHFHFFRYVLAHNGMLIALVYATVVYDSRPSARNMWTAFLAGNLLLALAIPVNLLLDANYFFLCEKPTGPTLLDSLGRWPWYILAGEFVTLLHFAAAYLPIWIWNRLSPPRPLYVPAVCD